MANKHQQISIGVDFIANLDKFTQGINNAKGVMSKLDISEQTRKGIDGLAEKMATEIDKIKNIASRGDVDILDLNKINTSMKHIESAYAQMIHKIEDMGGDSTFLKNDAKAISKLKEGQIEYKKAIAETEKQQKKFNDALEAAQKAQKEGGKESKKKVISDSKYEELEKKRIAADNQKRAAQRRSTAATKKVEEKISESDGKYTSRDSKGFKNTAAYQEEKKAIEEVRRAELELQKIRKELSESTTLAKQSEEAKELADNVDIAQKELNEFLNTQKKNATTDAFANVKKSLLEIKDIDWESAGIDLNQINNIEQLTEAAKKLDEEAISRLNAELPKLTKEMDTSDDAVRSARTELDRMADSAQTLDDKMSQINSMKQRITTFFGLQNAAMLARRAFQYVFNTVKDLDAVMTEAAVVTDFSIGDMWDQLPQYTNRANEFGLAIKDVYEADTLFYQQGLKTNEVVALSNETMKMARIAGLNTADATDRMTNALRGFNMELNETNAQNVADVYSELAAISASNVNELSVAMTKTASIASNAGASFENTAAFIAQIVETTRESAETAGTALKTVIARFTELKKDPSEIGEVDGEVVDANKIETALRSVGVALRDTNGEFRDFDDIILELSGKWDSLDVNTQRYIATIAAGSRQQSRFIALMSNNARLTQLTAAANSAAGASQEQYEKTLDSLATKLNKLKNAANEFLTTIGNSSVIKGTISAITSLINVINKATSLGPRWVQVFTKTFVAITAFFASGGILNALMTGYATMTKMAGEGGMSAGQAFSQGFKTGLNSSFGGVISFLKKNIFSKVAWVIPSPKINVKDLEKELSGIGKKLKDLTYKTDPASIAVENKLLERQIFLKKEINATDGLQAAFIKANTAQRIAYANAVKAGANAQQQEMLLKSANIKQTAAEIAATLAAEEADEEKRKEKEKLILAQLLENTQTKMGIGEKVKNTIVTWAENQAINAKAGSIWQVVTAWIAEKTAAMGATAASMVAAGWIGLIIALVAGLVIGVVALVNAINKANIEASVSKQLERAGEQLETFKERLEETQEAVEDLENSWSEYDDLQDTLEGLTYGTKEWREQLRKVNSQVLDLVTKYPELAKYMNSNNGVLSIDEKGFEEIYAKLNDSAIEASIGVQQTNLRTSQLKEKQLQEMQSADYNTNAWSGVWRGALMPFAAVADLFVGDIVEASSGDTIEGHLIHSLKRDREGTIGDNIEEGIRQLEGGQNISDNLSKAMEMFDWSTVDTEYYANVKDDNELKELLKRGNEFLKDDWTADTSINGDFDSIDTLTNREIDEIFAIEGAADVFRAEMRKNAEQLAISREEQRKYTQAIMESSLSEEQRNYNVKGQNRSSDFAALLAGSYKQDDELIRLAAGHWQNNYEDKGKKFKIGEREMDIALREGSNNGSNEWIKAYNDAFGKQVSDSGNEAEDLYLLMADISGKSRKEIVDEYGKNFDRLAEDIVAGINAKNTKQNTDKIFENLLKATESIQEEVLDFSSEGGGALKQSELKNIIGMDGNGALTQNDALLKIQEWAKSMGVSADDFAIGLGYANADEYAEVIYQKALLAQKGFNDNEQTAIQYGLDNVKTTIDKFQKNFGELDLVTHGKMYNQLTNTELRGGDSTQVSRIFSDILSKTSEKNREQVQNLLTTTDLSSAQSIYDTTEALRQLGLEIDSNTIKELIDFSGALADIDIQKALTEAISDFTLAKDVSERDEYERTFSEEDMKRAIEAGMNRSDFVFNGIDYTYIGNSMDSLVVALKDNTSALLDQNLLRLKEAVATGENYKRMIRVGRYDGSQAGFAEQAMKGYHSDEDMRTFMVEYLGYTQKQADEFNRQGLITAITTHYDDYFGQESKALEANKISLQESEQATEEAVYSTQNSGQDILNKMEQQEDKEEGSRVLQGRIQSEQGLEHIVNNVTKAYVKQGKAFEEINDLVMAHILDVSQTEKKIVKIKETWEEVGDTIVYAQKGSKEYTATIGQLTSKFQSVFGDHIKQDFLEQDGMIQLIEAYAAGGEEGEAAWQSIIQRATEYYMSINGYSENLKQQVLNTIKAIENAPIQADGTILWTEDMGDLSPQAKAALEGGYVFTEQNGQTVISKTTGALLNGVDSFGSGASYWENTFDRLYNLTVDINTELRERNKLEREYQRLLKDTENLTSQKIKENVEARGASLVNNINLEKTKIKDRRQQINELKAENSEFKDFVYWDEQGEPKINWNLFEAKTGVWSKEKGDEATEFVNQWKEWADEIFESEENIAEYEDELDELKDTGREEYLELEQKTYDAILKREEELIQGMEKISDSIDSASQDMLKGLQKSIQKLRQDRQNQETEQDIAEKEQQLTYLSSSTTGDPLEIMKLEKEIADARQSYTDQLIDQKISELEDQNEQARTQREKQIAIAQAQLDYNKENGMYWEEVHRVMQDGIGLDGKIKDDSQLANLLRNNSGFMALSKEKQDDFWADLDKLSTMSDAYTKGFAFPQIAQEDTLGTYLKELQKNNGSNNGNNDNTSGGGGETIQDKKTALAYTIAHSQTGKGASSVDGFDLTMDNIVKTFGKISSEDIREALDYISNNVDKFSSYGINSNNSGWKSNGEYRMTNLNTNAAKKTGFDNYQDTYFKIIEGEDVRASETNNKSEEKPGKPAGVDTEKKDIVGDSYQVTLENFRGAGAVYWFPDWSEDGPGEAQDNPFDWVNVTKGQSYEVVQTVVDERGRHYIKIKTNNEDEWISTSQFKHIFGRDLTKEELASFPKFKTGGLADFTGPAWLDGTKSAPEIVLNAQDTRNFLQLRDILSDLFKGGNFERSGSSGDNYYDIDINVDEISNDYDVDQLAARIKQQIVSDSMYRNVNAINFMR